jgi:hypothetical protein
VRLLAQLKFLLILLLFPFFVSAVETRSRVEELFIWKISDEMKLSVPDEKSFSELIRGLNHKKSKTNEEIQSVLKKLSKASERKEKEKLLLEHRRLLKSYNDLSLEEVDRIQKIFGIEQAAKYFVLKNDLTARLKSLLAVPEKPNQPIAPEKLVPPQIVEEK